MVMRSILILLAICLTAPAMAADASKAKVKAEEASSFSGLVNVSRSTSLYNFEDGTKKDGVEYGARLNYKISDKYATRAQIGYSQDLVDYENDDFSNLVINFFRTPSKFGNTFVAGYLLGLTLPTSKDASKAQSLQAGISAGLTAGINPEVLIKGLSISGAAVFARSFHRYETRLDGPVNIEYAANQSLSVGYDFASGISLSASFSYLSAWSYQGVMKNSFEINEEIGYQLHEHLAIAIGHTNGGSPLRANGTDSAIEVLNENESIVYASLTALF